MENYAKTMTALEPRFGMSISGVASRAALIEGRAWAPKHRDQVAAVAGIDVAVDGTRGTGAFRGDLAWRPLTT